MCGTDLRVLPKGWYDYFLYLWCGRESPLFDKSKMATFELYFLTDKTTYKEEKGYYFQLRDSEEVCDRILDAFGVTGTNRRIMDEYFATDFEGGRHQKRIDKILV